MHLLIYNILTRVIQHYAYAQHSVMQLPWLYYLKIHSVSKFHVKIFMSVRAGEAYLHGANNEGA